MLRNVKYWAAAATLTLLVAASAWAAVEATGKWACTNPRLDGSNALFTMELKQAGEKLTGTLVRKNGSGEDEEKNEILAGKITQEKDLSFVVVPEANSLRRTVYKGKLEGDTIKGTLIRMNQDGEERTEEWIATRGAPAAGGTGAQAGRVASGNQSILILSLKTAEGPACHCSNEALASMWFTDARSVNAYYGENSYGLMS